jgi:hypothetical protein
VAPAPPPPTRPPATELAAPARPEATATPAPEPARPQRDAATANTASQPPSASPPSATSGTSAAAASSEPRGAPGGRDTAAASRDAGAPAAATAGEPPPLNLELPRSRYGQGPLSTQKPRGALSLMPPPPERKSKLAEDVEKAGKPDCRNAHANLGLLAVVPLAADALKKDSGCKW